MKVDYRFLRDTFTSILARVGFTSDKAAMVAEVFAETTFDGVFSHGINRFPRFIRDVRSGTVDPDSEPLLTLKSGAMEQWDGQSGPGILNALHCTERAIALAKESGIGCAGLRNTNHWMRGGTYGWRAADRGFMFLGWTNTIPNMPAWPGTVPSLGNNPFILAIPRKKGNLVLDMAMSLYSYGKLEWYKKTGEPLPEFGGYDPDHRLTKDPASILESEGILPVGYWKGSAMAMVLDLAAAILSGGSTSMLIGRRKIETDLSQVFIAVDIKRFMGEHQINQLIDDTIQFNARLNRETRYPGQRSYLERKENHRNGIDVPDDIWKEIEAL